MKSLGREIEKKNYSAPDEGADVIVPETNPNQSELFSTENDLIVRVEKNTAKHHAFIFPRSDTPDLDKPRQKVIKRAGNSDMILTVAPMAGDTSLTEREGETLDCLYLLWHIQPEKERVFRVYFSDICKVKGIDPSQTKNHRAVFEDIRKLTRCSIEWEDSFLDKDGIPRYAMGMHIVNKFKLHDPKKAGENWRKGLKKYADIEFDEDIYLSLKEGRNFPLNVSVYFKLSGKNNRSFYRFISPKISHIDTSINPWKKLSYALFEELGLLEVNKSYRYKGNRLQALQRMVDESQGKAIVTGETLKLWIDLNKAEDDYMVFASKLPPDFARSATKRKPVNDADVASLLAQDMTQIVGKTLDLGWAEYLAKHYTTNFINEALGIFKEDRHSDKLKIEHPGKYFTKKTHTLAHMRGLEWVGHNCPGEGCEHDPATQKQVEMVI